jgi:hypothetical protein
LNLSHSDYNKQLSLKLLIVIKLNNYYFAPQGPALVAMNNGVFSEGDWSNIQNLGLSSKMSDPLKIGKFGLGFNSVYHLTGKNYQIFITLRYCIFLLDITLIVQHPEGKGEGGKK